MLDVAKFYNFITELSEINQYANINIMSINLSISLVIYVDI